jgi:hypothetical protein
LIVQGIKNAVECIIKGDNGKFDQILGLGSSTASDVIDCCFNMGGFKLPGSKFGLIDEYHIWCSLSDMDKLNYEWCITFVINGNMIQTFARNMIAHFAPADGTIRTEFVPNDLLSEFGLTA